MLRRIIVSGSIVAFGVAGSIALATGGSAAPGGGACQLDGTASFTPNGPGATSTFGYSVSGQLTNCQSNLAGAPTAGAFGVGQQYTVAVIIQTPTGPQPGQATYAAPLASGSGTVPVNSCPGGTTSGTGITTWPDGSHTVVGYTTTSAGPAVHLEGTVIPSVTLTLATGPAGAPATYDMSSDNASYPAGNGVQGAVAFTTSDPTQCNSAAGLSSVQLQGGVGIGNPS